MASVRKNPYFLSRKKNLKSFQTPEKKPSFTPASLHLFGNGPYHFAAPKAVNEQPLRNQSVLITKINSYIKHINQDIFNKKDKNRRIRPLLNPGGNCHGISLFWLQLMLQNRVDKFYEYIDKIAAHDEKKNDGILPSFEAFYSVVIKAQHPEHFFPNSNWFDIESMPHLNLQVTGMGKSEWSFAQLVKNLEKLTSTNDTGVCLSSYVDNSPHHSIAIARKNDKYYLFDPNFPNGRAKEYASLFDLLSQLRRSLYPLAKKLPSKLDILMSGVISTPEPNIQPRILS